MKISEHEQLQILLTDAICEQKIHIIEELLQKNVTIRSSDILKVIQFDYLNIFQLFCHKGLFFNYKNGLFLQQSLMFQSFEIANFLLMKKIDIPLKIQPDIFEKYLEYIDLPNIEYIIVEKKIYYPIEKLDISEQKYQAIQAILLRNQLSFDLHEFPQKSLQHLQPKI
jgi:hypothetical protein